jgi:hypothetical protein
MASLTPPPDDTEEAEQPALEIDPEREEAVDTIGSNVWEEYRRRRQIRGFNAAKIKLEPDLPISRPQTTEPTVPVPEAVETSPRAQSVPALLTANSNGTSGSGVGRRRRGEGQLLLDDHLLPEELRKTGTLAGKRTLSGGHIKPEEEVEVEAEAEVEAEPEASGSGSVNGNIEEENGDVEVPLGEEDGADGDEEETAEVTRCVCQRQGELSFHGQRSVTAKYVDVDDMFIQCDKCNVWQHGPCVGIWGDEEAPEGELYFRMG